ncbi:MAG: bifunctional precorrin-2 dehydrogenase/sirohydrochlorin ferrochelatase [Nitrospirae bacterium]|nr:bifunctional precorrin-2 dehydrogenase/sirohydrochlorin ferrochelatase [Nitrospirota bacterium]
MLYYPVFLNLKNKKAVVIGGGSVAERKAQTLLSCNADVSIISPKITPRLRRLAKEGKIEYIKKSYEDKDIKDAFIVVAATNDRGINEAIYKTAERYGCLLNIVDKPESSNFIVPSVISRGDLTIAISTGGRSPALSKQIRKELQQIYGREYEIFIKTMGKIRGMLLRSVSSEKARRRILTKLAKAQSGMIGLLKKGKKMEFYKEIERIADISIK